MMLNRNDIPIKYVPGSIASTLSASADFAKSVEGMVQAAFLPKPQSLKPPKKMLPSLRDAWLKAYRAELMNMISKDTFQHPTDYNGEQCPPIHTIHKTKHQSDGIAEKLKVRMVIHGDMD
jgi:hypothetical protein